MADIRAGSRKCLEFIGWDLVYYTEWRTSTAEDHPWPKNKSDVLLIEIQSHRPLFDSGHLNESSTMGEKIFMMSGFQLPSQQLSRLLGLNIASSVR